MEPIITTLGTIIVAILVFLAARLESKDQVKKLLAQAEILEKLPKNTTAHHLMERELERAITRYSRRQDASQDLWFLRLAVGILGLFVISMLIFGVNRDFDLGRAHDVVNRVAQGLLALTVGMAIGSGGVWVYHIWKTRKRSKSLDDDAAETEEPST